MDYISQTLNEIETYDLHFLESLEVIYESLSTKDKNTLESVVNSKIGNISLTPDKHIKLILYEWYVLNNPYKNPPVNLTLNSQVGPPQNLTLNSQVGPPQNLILNSQVGPPQNLESRLYYAYDSNGNKIYLESVLSGALYNYNYNYNTVAESVDSYVCIPNDYTDLEAHKNNYIAYSGHTQVDNNTIPVSISWFHPDYADIFDSLSIWNFIHESNIPTHYINLDYKFMGGYVLVQERLKPLDSEDYKPVNVYKLGIQILHILEAIHRYGVLTDLSPTNIGKNMKGDYYIVSYSNFTNTPLYYGYRRTYWNKSWSSSVSESDSVCTYRNDLLELGYLLNYLYLKNLEGATNTGIVNRVRVVEETVTPRIYEYMRTLKSSLEFDSNVYDILRGILNDSSLR